MDPTSIPIRDLHLPPEPGLWPLAPGWWLLIALLSLLALVTAWRQWQQYRANRARRFALAALAEAERAYDSDGNAVVFATRLSELLRRTMLAYAPRADVAGLTGDAWLRWLDRGLSQPAFSQGPGRLMLSLPYQRSDQPADDDNIRALGKLVRERVRTPLPEAR